MTENHETNTALPPRSVEVRVVPVLDPDDIKEAAELAARGFQLHFAGALLSQVPNEDDPEPEPVWTPKMLREHLCHEQTLADHACVEAIQAAIDVLDRRRPLGPDGAHSDHHTATCGCEDAPDPGTVTVTLPTDVAHYYTPAGWRDMARAAREAGRPNVANLAAAVGDALDEEPR